MRRAVLPNARVAITCARCNLDYEVGERQARRILRGGAGRVCPCCRHRAGHPSVEDERTYWLRRFDDATIAEMTRAIFGAGSVEAVKAWRARLLATSIDDAGPEPAPDESTATYQNHDQYPLKKTVMSEPVNPDPLGDHGDDDRAEKSSKTATTHRHALSVSDLLGSACCGDAALSP